MRSTVVPFSQLLFLTSRLVVIVNSHHGNTGCGQSYTEFEDNCYELKDQKVKWKDTKMCGNNATWANDPQNKNENDNYMNLANKAMQRMQVSGIYIWLKKTPRELNQQTWQNWDHSQPSAADLDGCAFVTDKGTWMSGDKNRFCKNDAMYYICVKIPLHSPCYNVNCGDGTCVDGKCEYCRPDPCVGGTCLTVAAGGGSSNFTCQCDEGYSGTFCKLDDDPCKKQPCKNGGTCSVQIRPGANEWMCLCPRTPEVAQARDCSEEERSKYPIPEKAMVAIVLIPFYILGIAYALFCVYECVSIGELPDLDWASHSSTSDSEDEEAPGRPPVIPREPSDATTEQITVVEDLSGSSERGNELMIDNKDITIAVVEDLSGISERGNELTIDNKDITLASETSGKQNLTKDQEVRPDVNDIEETGASVDPLKKSKKQARGRSFVDSMKSKYILRLTPSKKEMNKPAITSKTESSSTKSSEDPLNKVKEPASKSTPSRGLRANDRRSILSFDSQMKQTRDKSFLDSLKSSLMLNPRPGTEDINKASSSSGSETSSTRSATSV